MKILNIMTSYLDYNGIGTSLLNYYKNINNQDIQMDYLVPNKVDSKLKEEFTVKGNTMHEFYYKKGKLHQKRPLLYCIKLYKLIKKEKYDIVHAHGSSSMLFLQLFTAKLAGAKVRIAHSRNTQSDFGILNSIFKPIFKCSYNVAFACGKEAGEWLFGKKTKFTIIPNGKDSKMFEFDKKTREQIRKEYNLTNKIVIGHIGNFNYQKNHEYLIDIMNELVKNNSNYYLILAGNGEKLNIIKNKVEEFGLSSNVLFLGQIPVEKVAKWLNAMDLMVFPSRFEGFPNVLIEWQMNGLPCLISDSITQSVKITDLVQFASINDNPEKWSIIINNMELKDREKNKKELLKQIKEAGYDIRENATRLENLYIDLYNKKQKK